MNWVVNWYDLPGVTIPKCFQSCFNVEIIPTGISSLLDHIDSILGNSGRVKYYGP